MEWTYVKDELPDDDYYLLVNDGDEGIGIAYFSFPEKKFQSIFDESNLVDAFIPNTCLSADFILNEIKYWSHLPDAPIEN